MSLAKKCMEKTVKVTIALDKDSLRRMAPQAQIDTCLRKIGPKINWTLAWGIAHALFAYLAMIVVIWGRDYRRRLLEIREYEAAKNLSGGGRYDGVGLLLGTAPVGRSSSSRVTGSKKNAFERHQDNKGGTRPLSTNTMEELNGAGIIIRISGTVTSYENQGNRSPISQLSRTGSMVSSISDVSSLGMEISVEGQSFVTTSR